MDVVIVEDKESLGRAAAGLVVEGLRADPRLVLGVATGSSPVTTYRALVSAREAGLDFSQVRCVALDEYVGIPASDPASYHSFIRREIATPLGLRPENVLVPDGNARDLAAACTAFEDGIRSLGGVGIQLLGIGRNGHVGFNEPGSPFGSRTRVAQLSATTRCGQRPLLPAARGRADALSHPGTGHDHGRGRARPGGVRVPQGRSRRGRRGGAGDGGVPGVSAPGAPARHGDRRPRRRGRTAPDRPSPRLAGRRLARLTR